MAKPAKPQPSTFGVLGWKAVATLALPCVIILALNGHLSPPTKYSRPPRLDHDAPVLTPRLWNRSFESSPRPLPQQAVGSPSLSAPPIPSPASHYCSSRPWLDRYSKLHASIVKGDLPLAQTRYLIMRPHERAGRWGGRAQRSRENEINTPMSLNALLTCRFAVF
jgi:hypothetical protein